MSAHGLCFFGRQDQSIRALVRPVPLIRPVPVYKDTIGLTLPGFVQIFLS